MESERCTLCFVGTVNESMLHGENGARELGVGKSVKKNKKCGFVMGPVRKGMYSPGVGLIAKGG